MGNILRRRVLLAATAMLGLLAAVTLTGCGPKVTPNLHDTTAATQTWWISNDSAQQAPPGHYRVNPAKQFGIGVEGRDYEGIWYSTIEGTATGRCEAYINGSIFGTGQRSFSLGSNTDMPAVDGSGQVDSGTLAGFSWTPAELETLIHGQTCGQICNFGCVTGHINVFKFEFRARTANWSEIYTDWATYTIDT